MGIDGEDKWVAVFGGGYNIGSMEYASSIFVIDLEDAGINNAKRGGKLIKDINSSLSNNDKEFLISFKSGEPNWDLCNIENAQNFPSVKWKLHNIKKINP